MSKAFNPDDYVDVAERIQQFYDRFPEGRLTAAADPYLLSTESGRQFIVYHALAFRTPDDPHPGKGCAWEPLPGPTPFTKDSELQNAETAAWGRAIVAVGITTKKIASRQEVEARAQTSEAPPKQRRGVANDKQRRLIFAMAKDRQVPNDVLKKIVKRVAGVESSTEIPAANVDAILEAIDEYVPPDIPWSGDFEPAEAPPAVDPVDGFTEQQEVAK